MYDTVVVKAKSVDDAVDKAFGIDRSVDPEYLEDSMMIDTDGDSEDVILLGE